MDGNQKYWDLICKTLQVKHKKHVQNANFVCSYISLKSSWLPTKHIYIIDLDTLLQLLIQNKAFYLEIKTGLLQYLEGFDPTPFWLCREKNKFGFLTANDQTRRCECASKSMNPEQLERYTKYPEGNTQKPERGETGGLVSVVYKRKP